MMEKTGKVKYINDEIKKLENLKKEIQSECKHEQTCVKFTSGGNTPKTICCTCEKEIGYPSKERLEEFLSGKS